MKKPIDELQCHEQHVLVERQSSQAWKVNDFYWLSICHTKIKGCKCNIIG